jgi:hypothetical protein
MTFPCRQQHDLAPLSASGRSDPTAVLFSVDCRTFHYWRKQLAFAATELQYLTHHSALSAAEAHVHHANRNSCNLTTDNSLGNVLYEKKDISA